MFVWCFLVAAYATWPLLPRAGTYVMGNLGDPLEVTWRLAWAAHAVVREPLHIFDANIFHPEPLTLAYSENHLGVSLPLAPVFWVTGNALLTYNLAILLVLAAGGFGVYLFTYRATGSRGAALVAGTAYTGVPFRVSMAGLGHLHVLDLYLLPLVLLVLLRLHRDGSRRTIAVLGLLIALSWWTSLTGTFMAIVTVATWAVWETVRRRRQAWRPVGRAALGMAIGFVAAVPLLWPYVEVRRTHPEYEHPDLEVIELSATPGSYLSPPPGGRVVRAVYGDLSARFRPRTVPAEKELFPGFFLAGACAATAAGAVLHTVRRRRAREPGPHLPAGETAALVAVVGVVAVILSFGPRYGARPDGMPLPFMAVDAFIPGGLLRAPARLGALALLAMAVLAGIGLSWVRPSWRRFLVGGSLVVLVLELMPGVGLVEAPAPTAAHRAMARRPGAVLCLPTVELNAVGNPIGPTLPREAQHMYLSTVHFRPLTNGWGAYFPPGVNAFVAAVADLPSPAAFRALRARDVTTVVLQTELLPGTSWVGVEDRLARWPGVRLVRRSAGVADYDVAGATP
ncbi:MAG: 6-pyruvoyl-tetrahydropterin synthase-related protein, partial [Acidimicrobiales bacterium]